MNQFLPINSLGNQTDAPVSLPRAPWEAVEAPQAQVRPKGSDDTPMQRWAPTPRLRPAVKADPVFPIITASGEALFTERQLAVRLRMQADADKHEGKLPTFPGSKPSGNRKKGQKVTVLSVIRDHGPCTTAVVGEIMGRPASRVANRANILRRMGQIRTVGKDGAYAIYEAVK